MAVSQNFPNILPTLNLDFANQKELDPRVTFSRSSSGTYVGRDGLIKTARVNEPRFDHDPVTGVCNGLLVEESRTNLLLRSEEFDSGSWIPNSGGTGSSPIVTANYGTAPNGTITADRIQFALNGGTTTSDISSIRQAVTVVLGTTYSASFWARSTDGISSYNVQFRDDIASIFGSVIKITGSWQRFTFPSGTAGSTNCNFRWWLRGIQGTSDSADILIWGAQLEVGSSATSYIPTTSSTVTRAADTILLSGNNFSSFYNTSGGSLVASVNPIVNITSNQNILTIGDGTTSNNINLIVSPNTSGGIYATNSGVRLNTIGSGITQSDVTLLGFDDRSLTIATNFSNNNFNLNYNSSGVGTSSSGTLPTISQMIIGAGVSSTNRFTGTISRISYYPTSLSTSNLSSLSTASPPAAVVSTPNNNQYQFIIRVPSNNYTYTLLTNNSGTYRYNVDWGDGTSTNNITTNNPTKVYKTAGYYRINVTQNTGSFYFYNAGNATYGPNLTYITGTGSSFNWSSSLFAAWYGCSSLTSFPLIDTSKGTSFINSWFNCSSLTSFPLINTSNGTNFTQTWYGCRSLTSFPNLNFSSGTNFFATWRFSSGITSFSTGFSFGGAGNTSPTFSFTWDGCTRLSSFPAGAFNACTGSTNYTSAFTNCGLGTTSIENILTSIVSSGATINTPVPGTIGLDGGTNASKSTWSTGASNAFNTLVGAGWTISYNP